MVLWLPYNRDSTVPPFATHHCGVGAAILHEDKLLVVREKIVTHLSSHGNYLEDMFTQGKNSVTPQNEKYSKRQESNLNFKNCYLFDINIIYYLDAVIFILSVA